MGSIYEIYNDILLLETYGVDPETGEILPEDEWIKKYDEIQMALEDKIENSMAFYKNLMADVETYKQEAKNITERAKRKELTANRIKDRVDYIITQRFMNDDGVVDMEQKGKFKFETPKVKLSYRKSESLGVVDVSLIPKKYIKPRKIDEKDVDKASIKKILQDAEKQNKKVTIKGAVLNKNLNMTVK